MAIIAEVGLFTISFQTGNFTVNLSNFGGTAPKAVIFLGGMATDYSLGFSVATPTQSMIFGYEFPSQSTMLNSRFRRNDAVHIGSTDGFGGVQSSIAHVSFAPDQFTVDIGAIGGSANSDITFLALGGSDLTDVAIVEWLSSTTNGPRSITGVGFQPDAAINLCTTGTSVFEYGVHGAISFWDGTTNITKQLSSENGVSTSNCKRHLTGDAVRVTGHANNVRNQASLTSFDADGFTLDYSQSDSTAFQNYTLCLKGGSFKVGQSLSPISPQTVTEAVGFPANACLALSAADTAYPTVNGSDARFHFGVSDLLGNNRAHSFGAQDGLSTSSTSNARHASAAVAIYDSSMSAVDQASVTASGNDLEFDFTGADTTQRVFFYMAMGPPSVGPTPLLPTGTGTFDSQAAGTVVTVAPPLLPTGTGTFDSQSSGDVTTLSPLTPTGTGNFDSQSSGDVTLIKLPVGVGSFDSQTAGDVLPVKVPTGTGSFDSQASGTVTIIGVANPTGTGTFDSQASGVVTPVKVPTGTGTFDSQSTGVVIVIGPQLPTGTGTFDSQAAGDVTLIKKPVGAGSFDSLSAGDVVSAAPPALLPDGTGTFDSRSTGFVAVIGAQFPTGIGTFDSQAAGSTLVHLKPVAAGSFDSQASGVVGVVGAQKPTGTGLFDSQALGEIFIIPRPVGTGTFSSRATGVVAPPPKAAIGRRLCELPEQNRTCIIPRDNRQCEV